MSENNIENSENMENVNEKPKRKGYTEKHKLYMREYRAKNGSYRDAQKASIKKYQQRIKQEAKQFRELQAKGLILDETN